MRAVMAVLKDRRMGREAPTEAAPEIAPHLRPFYAVEAQSMLELEPPRHTRLRSLVLRAFTSRRIKALGPEIEALCHQLIDSFPSGEVDLLAAYAQKLPVIVIARLLGVPEAMAAGCDYQHQLEITAELVAAAVGRSGQWDLVFQSRSGPPR